MGIRNFRFCDKFRGWDLNEMSFSAINLLVGKSGVGKTNILNSLRSVRNAGVSGAHYANGCDWRVDIDFEGAQYTWSAKTSLAPEQPFSREFNGEGEEDQTVEHPRFLKERILLDEKTVLVKRDENEFIYKGTSLPKLKNTESAIALLKDEESIAPLNKALRRILFSRARDFGLHAYDYSNFKNIKKRCRGLEGLREAGDIPTLVKAFILQEYYPDEFERIKNEYMEIFDTVLNIEVGKLSDLDAASVGDAPRNGTEWLAIGVKENGVKGWITSPRLSSGMHRILSHLIELALAPPETVVIIDEIENSLGVNCLPDLTKRFRRRPSGLQFIMTSHHPYIIQNIPPERWAIVSRGGSVVSVVLAKSISGVDAISAHDKFVQLINHREFGEGIR